MLSYIQNKRLSRFIYNIASLETNYRQDRRIAQIWTGEYWCYPWYLYGVFSVMHPHSTTLRFWRLRGLSNDELFMAYWLSKNTRKNEI